VANFLQLAWSGGWPAPLPIACFPWLAGILLAYCVLIQAVKTVYRRRFGLWL